MTLRLRFWLAALDALAAVGLFGSRPYLWVVGKASDATDWGDPGDFAGLPQGWGP